MKKVLKFLKMQGIGNDYVYMDMFSGPVEDPVGLAVRVSDRHFGIGSDGLILIGPSGRADFSFDMYNADGSRSEMCGNGLRCAAKYVYDKKMTEKTEFTFETLAGLRSVVLHTEDGVVRSVTADMGVPQLRPGEIPVVAEACENAPYTEVSVCGYTAVCVSMGNPHAVIFTMEDLEAIKLDTIGPGIEHAPIFPRRVNAEFVNVLSPGEIRMRVWERGTGETLACGTGACACAVAAMLKGYTRRNVTVNLRGGQLEIRWDEIGGHVFMTGPAVTVFEGEYLLNG